MGICQWSKCHATIPYHISTGAETVWKACICSSLGPSTAYTRKGLLTD